MLKKIVLKVELLTIKKIYSKPALLIWWCLPYLSDSSFLLFWKNGHFIQ